MKNGDGNSCSYQDSSKKNNYMQEYRPMQAGSFDDKDSNLFTYKPSSGIQHLLGSRNISGKSITISKPEISLSNTNSSLRGTYPGKSAFDDKNASVKMSDGAASILDRNNNINR